MSDNFIKDVEFKNFKCFQDLKVKNLKRVNLIGGKNNIGKTSFLEGLEMLLKPRTAFGVLIIVSNITRRRQDRKNNPNQPQQFIELDFFNELKSDISLYSGAFNLNLKFIDASELVNKPDFNKNSQMQDFFQNPNINKMTLDSEVEISFSNSDKLSIPISQFRSKIFSVQQDIKYIANNVNFISSCIADDISLAVYYGSLSNLNKEEYLNESLKQFDENIILLKAIPIQGGTVFKLRLQNREQLVLLSSFGEGINRYIAILCAIWASKDGYLFIDEIENGIHYTNYEKLWKIIFEASKMANCQIFATTHSKECIEAFNKVNESDEGIYLEFYRNQKNGLIVVKERDNEQLEYALTHNREVRGE